jgi:hypothetical protein
MWKAAFACNPVTSAVQKDCEEETSENDEEHVGGKGKKCHEDNGQYGHGNIASLHFRPLQFANDMERLPFPAGTMPPGKN